jgi:hypothetical protein
MKRWVLVVALLASSAAGQVFHPQSPGGTKVTPAWPQVCDVGATVQKFMWVMDWLVLKGAPQGGIFFVRMQPIPGFPEPPELPFVRFEKPGFEPSIHDYCLVIKSPSVTLTELQVAFKFGNPFEAQVYRDPQPPVSDDPPPAKFPGQPENPIGPAVEGRECLFYPALGDKLPAGSVYQGKRKVLRRWAFGESAWWECVK